MNKLLGFYELRELGIPTVHWEKFQNDTKLTNEKLWTIRTAVYKGNDFNLPRMVGSVASEAEVFGKTMIDLIGENGIVVYYPFFKALKSGTMQISKKETIIEAVAEDLWNLVTEHKLDVSIEYRGEECKIHGDITFLTTDEIELLKKEEQRIKSVKANDLRGGDVFLLEWSFACDVDEEMRPIGDKYLIFYECRTI